MIRPAANRECAVPVLPEPCCHYGTQVGRRHTPWAVFVPYRFSGSQCFFINLIDKSLFHWHSCRVVAGKHPCDFRREKTRKEAALSACSHPSRVFQISWLFNSRRLFGLKKRCVAQMGIAVPLSTFSIPKKFSHNLVSPNGGKSISNKSSIIILWSLEERIYT